MQSLLYSIVFIPIPYYSYDYVFIITHSLFHFHQFTGKLQNTFRNITAQAINMYCEQNAEKCNILDDGSGKRDVHLTLQDLLKRYTQLLYSYSSHVNTLLDKL